VTFEQAAGAGDSGVEQFPVDFPLEFGVDDAVLSFSGRCGFGRVYGSGTFDDPHGQEGALLAVRHGVYLVRANAAPVLLRIPAQERITGPVRFVQTFEKVLMFRGGDADVLEWQPLPTFAEGYGDWVPIQQTSSRESDDDNTFGDGTALIPRSSEAVAFNNRVFVVDGRDEIVVSDILDYTRYSRVRGRWQVNAGTASRLTRLFPFNQTSLLAFKQNSVYLIGNVYGDLSEAYVDVLTQEYGCLAPRSVLQVGKDVMFLSEAGYFAVSQALDNKLQAGSEPLSAPIDELMSRINWNVADRAVAAYHENRVYLAVPLDESLRNNAVLVFNTLAQAWEGYWTADYLGVQSFLRLQRGGKRRLFIVNEQPDDFDALTGTLLLVDAGYEDILYGRSVPIACEFVSRGYAANTVNQKDYLRLIVDQATWEPAFSVAAHADGVNEQRLLAGPVSRDRRKYLVHGRGLFDPAAQDAAHESPWRQDYSIYLEADTGLFPGEGVDPSRLQRVQYPYHINLRGAYMQARIQNTTGRTQIHSITVEARAGARSSQERK